ncbi:PREDICTED: NUT family member 2G isoform X2 [Chinchilla lanigera]|uniref:NUT family member 2G isoform X2 n=1 Tax=Chinchilla lanigera TaxID=34839 RepID=UPI0006975FB5|nr:PREDICTED: NUT family member 2G isoform X2 [Chinchilla lanigera]
MALEAPPVLQPDMPLNNGVILSPSCILPPLPPVPVPVQQLHWKLLPPPFGNAPLPQPKPLVLSPFPGIPVVAGHGGYGLKGAGPCIITAQAGTAGRPPGSLLTQVVLTQGPLIIGAPGVLHRVVQHPAPWVVRAPPMTTMVAAPIGVNAYADNRVRPRGLRPPTIPPVPSNTSGANKVPPPRWDCGEGGLATSQANASPDHTYKSARVYENFRHWQYFKTLLRRHLPHTPDVEAVSCFLVPMLRSLSRQQPTMSVEEGLRIGVREWDRRSNSERTTFYEVAAEFMRFEATEEMKDPRLLLMGRLLDCPLPAPRRSDPPRSSDVVQQPGCSLRQTGSKAQAPCPSARKCQQSQETKVPDDIPPEAMREYIDTMDSLEVGHLLAMGQPDENQKEEQQQEEHEKYPDPDLLSYCDELCSQEDFVTKVEAVINPQFLVEAESTDIERDIILAVGQTLEEEHRLTPEQLVEKRLLGSEAKGDVCRPWSQAASQSATHQSAEQDDCDPEQRADKETCLTPKASQVPKKLQATDEEFPGSEVPAILHRQQSPDPLGTSDPSSIPQDLAPRCALGLRGSSPTVEPFEPVSGLGEDEGDFSNLFFLLASPRQLLPWEWPQAPGPEVDLLCPEGPTPQASPPQGGDLSPNFPPSAKSKKRVLTGGSAPVRKMSCPGPSCEVSGGQDLAQGPVPPLWPQKGRCNKLGSQRRRKRH